MNGDYIEQLLDIYKMEILIMGDPAKEEKPQVIIEVSKKMSADQLRAAGKLLITYADSAAHQVIDLGVKGCH